MVTATVILFVFTYGNRPSTENPSRLISLLTIDYASIARGQIWRLLSAPFVHSGILQLFFCSLGLYFFGGYVSRRLGTAWFLFTYVCCGALGGFLSALVSGGGSFEAAPAAVFGIIFLCMIYFPFMYFFRKTTARRLGPIIICAILLSSLTIAVGDVAYLAQLAALPLAYGIYKLEPLVERIRSWRKLRREIVGAFTEAEREEHLDRLLKKVANEGMDSLNRKEKHFLQTVSKEYRRKKVNNH